MNTGVVIETGQIKNNCKSANYIGIMGAINNNCYTDIHVSLLAVGHLKNDRAITVNRFVPMAFALIISLSANADNGKAQDELCKACQRIFNAPPTPIYPEIAAKCSDEQENNRTWCEAKNLALYYLKRDQALEFQVLFDNIIRRCPTPQLREYFKQRLYYLATRLDAEDIPFTEYRHFDFGPIDTNILGQLRSHGYFDIRGKEYELAVARHHPPKHKFLERMLSHCQDAQQGVPPDAPQAAPR